MDCWNTAKQCSQPNLHILFRPFLSFHKGQNQIESWWLRLQMMDYGGVQLHLKNPLFPFWNSKLGCIPRHLTFLHFISSILYFFFSRTNVLIPGSMSFMYHYLILIIYIFMMLCFRAFQCFNVCFESILIGIEHFSFSLPPLKSKLWKKFIFTKQTFQRVHSVHLPSIEILTL